MYSSAQNCKIYVGNLPDYIRPRDIEDIFWKFGRIRNVDLHDRSRGPPFAFVEFEEERGADDAVHYRNGYDFEGFRLRVETPRTPKYLSRPSRDRDPYDRLGDPWGYPPRSSRAPPPPRRRRRSSSRRGEFRVLVADLPRSASWQDLKDHFREAGEIIYTDASSDGTGVLEFSTRKAMDYAVKHFDNKKFRSHQGESSHIRVRASRKLRKSPSRSRSRTRSRERRSHSRSKSRSPRRSKRTRSRERDNSRSRDKSESKYRRNRSSRSCSRKGRDSRDYSRGNSVESREMDESPRRKKMRKELKRGRSGSVSSEENEKVRRKSRRDKTRLDSRGSHDGSSRENSDEHTPSKSSDRSRKDSMSPLRNSEPQRDETPDASPERRAESRGSTPRESSESRKSSRSSSPSGTPIQNSSPEHNPESKANVDSPLGGLHENGSHLNQSGDAAAGIEREDSLSDEPESMDA